MSLGPLLAQPLGAWLQTVLIACMAMAAIA